MTDENPPAELEQFTGDPSYSVLDALALPLMYHGGHLYWTEAMKAEWRRITGADVVSTKVMCDHIRSVIYLTMDAAQRAGMMTEAEMRERLAKYAAVRDVQKAPEAKPERETDWDHRGVNTPLDFFKPQS